MGKRVLFLAKKATRLELDICDACREDDVSMFEVDDLQCRDSSQTLED